VRSNNEFQNNLGAKKMVITERDPKKMRVRAKVMDEDEVETYWLDVLSKSSSSNKSFEMPDEGDEIWAMVDPKGEEGFVVGSRYNDKETPPGDSNEQVVQSGPWGRIEMNKATGALSVKLNGGIKLDLGGLLEVVANQIDTTTGGTITNNGKNIGHDHKHKEVTAGVDKTGEPD
jgi:phage baseplate assembly protein gpV